MMGLLLIRTWTAILQHGETGQLTRMVGQPSYMERYCAIFDQKGLAILRVIPLRALIKVLFDVTCLQHYDDIHPLPTQSFNLLADGLGEMPL